MKYMAEGATDSKPGKAKWLTGRTGLIWLTGRGFPMSMKGEKDAMINPVCW
jgi:hypothetical protein